MNGHSSVMGGVTTQGRREVLRSGLRPLQGCGRSGPIADDRFLCLPPPPLPCIPALSAAQTSKHISHILAFDSLQGLICGIHWGGSMAMLDREVSF